MATTSFTDNSTVVAASWLNDVDTHAYGALTTVAGTANAITATGPASMTGYSTGQVVRFIPGSTNTSTATINITPSGSSALGAKNIFCNGAACAGGEIVANVPTFLYYDGTQYNIIGSSVAKNTIATTFTFNGSGGTSASVTVTWQRVGAYVTLNIPQALATSGTSSTQFISDTALPAAIRPAAQADAGFCRIRNNGVTATPLGVIFIGTNGIITILRDGAATAWTDGASSGLAAAETSAFYFTG